MMNYYRFKKILGDGNCLFRCFSYFLFNNDDYHNIVRKNIVEYVTNNWDEYFPFIIGNNHYENVTDKNTYYSFMISNHTYGSEIEIYSFVKLYEVLVTVYVENNNEYRNYGNISNTLKLTLVFSGDYEGSYDFILLI